MSESSAATPASPHLHRATQIGDSKKVRENPTRKRYATLAALSTVAILAYFSRNAVSVAESTIRNELALTEAESGWLMGAFFCSYAGLGIPIGWLGHKIGSRRVLTSCLVVSSVAIAIFQMATGLAVLVAAQLLMGAAQAGLMPCTVQSVSAWMPATRRAFSCACLGAGMQVGAILSAVLTGWLIKSVDWRDIFLWYAIPGFIGAIGFYAFFKDEPRQARRVNAAELSLIKGEVDLEQKRRDRSPTPWAAFLSSRTLWFLSFQQVFRAAGYMFFASWLPSFLQETRDVTTAESGLMQGLVFAAALAGTLAGGTLVDWLYLSTKNKTLSRVGVGSVSMFLCGALVLASLFVSSAMVAVSLMAMGSFLAAMAGPCAFTATIDVGGAHVPQVVATMNSAGNVAAAICPILVGMLFASVEDWSIVLWVFAAIYVGAALCWLLVDVERPLVASSP